MLVVSDSEGSQGDRDRNGPNLSAVFSERSRFIVRNVFGFMAPLIPELESNRRKVCVDVGRTRGTRRRALSVASRRVEEWEDASSSTAGGSS